VPAELTGALHQDLELIDLVEMRAGPVARVILSEESAGVSGLSGDARKNG